MENLKDKVALVADNGLFAGFAQTLSREFGRVLYWTPWWSAFPKSNDRLTGVGLQGVERVNEFFDFVDKADIIIFPDVYMGDLQVYLEEHGKRVWGARYGEELELDRWQLKRLLEKLKLPIPPSTKIIGTEALRRYLIANEGVWIKVSALRGDFETKFHQDYRLTEPWLDSLEHKLGAKKEIEEFIVEQNIDPAVEIGYDGFTVDGKWPETSLFGYEIKDCGYVITVRPYESLPEPVKLVNNALSQTLKNYRYRGFFSTEIRHTPEGESFLIDPCTRLGSPPSEVYMEMYSNWGQIIWHGAEGEVVEPKVIAKYGVEAVIHSRWADEEWAPIYIPEEIRPWVKLRNHTVIRGKDYVVPHEVGLPEIGAVVGIGDTLMEAIEACKSNAEKIEGFELEIKLDAIGEALNEITKAKELGIEFTDDPLPSVEEVNAAVAG